MNSPETVVFSKSRNLFALNLAKKSKSEYFLLAEGNVDVVSLHQAGFDSAVASLGTSLTEQQAQLLSRYKSEVIIAYDNDGAGSKATSRAIGLFEKLDVRVRVLRLDGEQKDPDEYIQARGAEAFRKLIENSENRMEYRLRSVRERFDLTRPEDKAAFASEAVRLVAQLPMQAERQVYSAVIAEQIGVKPEAVQSDVENQRKRQLRRSEEKETRDLIGRTVNQRKYENPASAIAEEGIVRLLYLEPSLIHTEGLPSPSDFTDKRLAKLYEQITGKLRRGELVSTATMGELLENEEMSLLVEIVEEPENLAESAKTLADYRTAMKNAAPKSITDILTEKQNQEKGKR
jgi:DNA primase